MRTIGIDLAIAAAHKAIVMEADGTFITPTLSFHTRRDEIEGVVIRAREGAPPDDPLRAVMEPTGMMWLPVSVALEQMGVTVYLVNGRRVHDLRRFYKRHSSSDRISCRVLAKLPLSQARIGHGSTRIRRIYTDTSGEIRENPSNPWESASHFRSFGQQPKWWALSSPCDAPLAFCRGCPNQGITVIPSMPTEVA